MSVVAGGIFSQYFINTAILLHLKLKLMIKLKIIEIFGSLTKSEFRGMAFVLGNLCVAGVVMIVFGGLLEDFQAKPVNRQVIISQDNVSEEDSLGICTENKVRNMATVIFVNICNGKGSFLKKMKNKLKIKKYPMKI